MKNYKEDDSCHSNLIQKLMISDALRHNPYVGSFQSIYRSSHSPNDEHMWSARNSPHVGSFRHAPATAQPHSPLKRSLGLKSLIFDAPPEKIISHIDMKNKKRVYLRHLSPDTVNHKFPKMLFSSSEKGEAKCMICNLDFSDGCELRTLCCSHYFHSACIEPLLNRSPLALSPPFQLCPTCEETPSKLFFSSPEASEISTKLSARSANFSPNSLIDASFCSSSICSSFLLEEDTFVPLPVSIAPKSGISYDVQVVNSLVIGTSEEEFESPGVCEEFDFSSVGSYLLNPLSPELSPRTEEVTPYLSDEGTKIPSRASDSTAIKTFPVCEPDASGHQSAFSVDNTYKSIAQVAPPPEEDSHQEDTTSEFALRDDAVSILEHANTPPSAVCAAKEVDLILDADCHVLMTAQLDSDDVPCLEHSFISPPEHVLEKLPVEDDFFASHEESSEVGDSGYSLCGVPIACGEVL